MTRVLAILALATTLSAQSSVPVLNLISADVVEVSPAYDHAELTSLAAATIVYELTNLFAKS